MKIIYGASKLIFLFVLIAINANLIFASTAYLLSSILTLIFSLIILRRKIGKILPEFDKKYSLSVLKESYPLVYWFFFVMLLSNLDVIFLSWLKGDYITGIYSAPSRFMINGFILAEMIIVAAYPHFVEHYKKDQKRFVRVIQTLTSAFFIVVLPISAISMIFNKGIITIVFGSDFTEGSSVFGIFSLILFLYYFIVLYGGLFIIARRIKMLTLIAIFVTAVQIITTYFMILKFSFNGAAYATLLSYLLFAVLAHVSFKKYSVHINIEKLILKIIPVFLLLLITLYLFRTKPVTALILIPTYFILLIIFKVVDRENVFLFFDSINLTKMARMFKQK
jgi:O-antigen/teichoic acid export membrane protein